MSSFGFGLLLLLVAPSEAMVALIILVAVILDDGDGDVDDDDDEIGVHADTVLMMTEDDKNNSGRNNNADDAVAATTEGIFNQFLAGYICKECICLRQGTYYVTAKGETELRSCRIFCSSIKYHDDTESHCRANEDPHKFVRFVGGRNATVKLTPDKKQNAFPLK